MRALMMTAAVGVAVVFGTAAPAGAGGHADPGLRSLCGQLADRPRTGPAGVRLLVAAAGFALVVGGRGIAARRR